MSDFKIKHETKNVLEKKHSFHKTTHEYKAHKTSQRESNQTTFKIQNL